MAWIDAVRTTRYRLILMLCYDVFKFLVKQGVPSDEDLEWLYPSCLLYEKESFLRFRSIATRDIDHMWPNPFIWRWLGLKKKKEEEQDIFCSRMWAWIFRVKRCTVGMRYPLAQTQWPWNKFIRRRLIRKGKSSIANMNLLAQIICSELMVF